MNLGSGLVYLLGDANLDGTVDGADFMLWNANKFTVNASWCSGDFDANGRIDGLDWIQWNNNKFRSSDGAGGLQGDESPGVVAEVSAEASGPTAPLRNVDALFAAQSRNDHRDESESNHPVRFLFGEN